MPDRPVSEIMVTDLATVTTDDRLSTVRRLMRERQIHHIPVVAGKRLIGLISLADVLELSFAEFITDPAQRDVVLDERGTVETLMQTKVETLSPQDTLLEAARRLSQGDVHSLPVVDAQGDLVGMLTTTDLVRDMAKGL